MDRSETEPRRFDAVIRNVRVIDGTGASSTGRHVAIAGERIAALSDQPAESGWQADLDIDGQGLVAAPGFIDVHTHDDHAVLTSPLMEPKVSQGVTTVVIGNCGISLPPLVHDAPPPPLNLLGETGCFRFPRMADYLAAVRAARPNVNVAALVGHGTLRVACMSDLDRPATPTERAAMADMLEEAMQAGAIGMSSGLYYKTSNAAPMEEVVELARVLGKHGGIYTTHMRNEHDGVLESLRETVDTARQAGVAVVISHHKCAGPANWGRSVETLAFIDQARAAGAVGLDAYPYAAGSTVLDPDWVDEAVTTLVTSSEPHPDQTGKILGDIAAQWGCSHAEAARRLSPAGAVYFQMDEADVRRIISYPPTMIGSDGLPNDVHPHPRLWGAFPRVLGHYSRELGLFDLETAIHKMTGLSAATFGLADRGVIREGAFADLVVFDAETILDRATFETPKQRAAGIAHVFVNGVRSYGDGEMLDGRAGQVLGADHPLTQ